MRIRRKTIVQGLRRVSAQQELVELHDTLESALDFASVASVFDQRLATPEQRRSQFKLYVESEDDNETEQ